MDLLLHWVRHGNCPEKLLGGYALGEGREGRQASHVAELRSAKADAAQSEDSWRQLHFNETLTPFDLHLTALSTMRDTEKSLQQRDYVKALQNGR